MRPLKKLHKILKAIKIGVVFTSRGDVTYELVNRVATLPPIPMISIPMGLHEVIRHTPEKFEQHLVRTIAHELGHYLLVSPERRQLKDYGIPEWASADLNYARDGRPSLAALEYEIEEERAQILERDIVRRLGYNCGLTPRRIKYFKNRYQAQKWWVTEGKGLVDDLFKNERNNVAARRRTASPILGSA